MPIAAMCLLAPLLAVPVAEGHSKRHARSKCPPPRGYRWLADAQAEVYLRPEGISPTGRFEGEGFFGCAYGHPRRTFELGPPESSSAASFGGVAPKALVGTIVAYEHLNPREMTVRDLRNGRILRRLPIGKRSAADNTRGPGSAQSVVLKADGSVAWIDRFKREATPGSPLTTEYEVEAIDGAGTRVLAVGTDIAPKSLALAGSTLYWTQGGKPFSAVLK
jgi:hypothetical protein